jgi:hypothetical protein
MAPNNATLSWICGCENLRGDREKYIHAFAAVRVAVLSAVVCPPVAVMHLYDVPLAVGCVFAATMPHVAVATQEQRQDEDVALR